MKIGEFSKLTGLPVKTIRYYSDIGLLIPDYVDEDNNYRSYNEEHIKQLNRIISLKGAGFLLKEISELMKRDIPDREFIHLLEQKLCEASHEEMMCRNKIEHLKGYIHQLKYKEKEAIQVNINELQITDTKPYTLSFENNQAMICSGTDTYMLETPDKYTLPIRIDMKAKTDSTNIRLYFGSGQIIFNWEYKQDELRIHDILTQQLYAREGQGKIPVDEFVDISWLLDKEMMRITVNGEVRAELTDMPYIDAYKTNPELSISSKVGVGSAWGSCVTIKNLNVVKL